MLISDSKRFVFIHVPKCAGTSMEAALAPYALSLPRSKWHSLLRRLDLPRDYRRFKFARHAPLRQVERKMPRSAYEGYFKFAFVRNPWDRLVSEYNRTLNEGSRRRHRRVRAMESFMEYLRWQAPRPAAHQHRLLVDSSGDIGVDFVGRFETLERDFERVRQRIAVECELPHLKGYAHAHYRDYYDDEAREFVRRHWASDIEAFGYEF